MAFDITINAPQQLAVVRLIGAVNTRTIYRAAQQLIGHARWTPGFAIIWDGRKVTQLATSPDETNHLIQQMKDLAPLLGEGRSACVTGRDTDAMFVHLLVHRLRNERGKRRVFIHLAPAIQWACEPEPSDTMVRNAILRSTRMG